MKKMIFTLAAGIVAVGMLSACSSNKNNNDSAEVVEEAVGEVIDMPSNDSDSTVIATGEAIAVQESAAAPAN